MSKYLMRFDDINANMDWERFFILKKILEKYNIKSVLGVVPKCEDLSLKMYPSNSNYYDYLKKFKLYGDCIAQHGYKHKYDSNLRGNYGSANKSEFAGHSFDTQFEKLNKGKLILKNHSLWEPVFMAPGHSFDSNTLKALKKLNFKIVLDGFSLFPFKKSQLTFAPQISSKPLPKFLPGLSQLCVHINTISDKELKHLICFVHQNHRLFISVQNINSNGLFISRLDQSIIYFLVICFRKIRNVFYFLIKIKNYFKCFVERITYKIKYRKIDLYKWHLKGTFCCRSYKKVALEIINANKPYIYIDIGCGLGEILKRVNLDTSFKIGYDIDKRLKKVHIKYNQNNFKFFTEEERLFKYVSRNIYLKQKIKFISILNFAHNLSEKKLLKILSKYYKKIGEYLLLIDSIYVGEKKYKYNHHEFLYNHKGLIKYFHKTDNLRSLYFLKIGK